MHPNEVRLVEVVGGDIVPTAAGKLLAASLAFCSPKEDALIAQYCRQLDSLRAQVITCATPPEPCDCGDCGECGRLEMA